MRSWPGGRSGGQWRSISGASAAAVLPLAVGAHRVGAVQQQGDGPGLRRREGAVALEERRPGAGQALLQRE
jgi:hypothetical protein